MTCICNASRQRGIAPLNPAKEMFQPAGQH
jgi:hypothetical protein